MLYLMCVRCGHQADTDEKGENAFSMFHPVVDLSKMTPHERLHFIHMGHEVDLEVECPKCTSTDVRSLDWPAPRKKVHDQTS